MRLLSRREWFAVVASASLYEAEFERIVLQQAPYLFPNYRAIVFRPAVNSEYGRKRPDIALIHEDYRDWWVCEVELAHHDLERHVLPQIAAFSTADWGSISATTLSDEDPALDTARIAAMLKGQPPGVLVIVNEDVPEWESVLAPFNVRFAVLQIFRSDRNEAVYRFESGLPHSDPHRLSICIRELSIPRHFRVISPGALNVDVSGRLTVRAPGGLAVLRRIDAGDRVWLVPERSDPLPPTAREAVLELDDESEHPRFRPLQQGSRESATSIRDRRNPVVPPALL